MNIPKHLKYSKTHEWAEVLTDGTVKIGLTDFAQSQMGKVVFVNLPAENDVVTAGEVFGDVESVKTVSDVVSPVSGIIKEINAVLLDSPEQINDTPYEAWLIQVRGASLDAALMDAAAYEAYCEQEG